MRPGLLTPKPQPCYRYMANAEIDENASRPNPPKKPTGFVRVVVQGEAPTAEALRRYTRKT